MRPRSDARGIEMSDTHATDADARVAIVSRWADVPDPRSAQQIQNLLQTYALLCDAGRTDELAELFTAASTWDGRDHNYGYYQGPEAIAAAVAGHRRADAPMMHLPGPAVLTAIADDEVHGVSWCLATRWTDGETIPYIHFYYEDVLRRGPDGQWRIHHRRLRPAFPLR